MQIHGFNKTTLIDYPKHLAATLFLGSCDFRCPFCHNASLVLRPETQPVYTEEEVLETLNKRRGILEGVCITGGEPTLHTELPDFIRKVKSLGLAVKLDTNGIRPRVIESLLRENLLDYIAMDIKSSKENYAAAAGLDTIDLKPLEETVGLIRSSGISYEFRTTAVKGLHTLQDFYSVGAWLDGSDSYYLQNFADSGDLIGGGFSSFTREELLYIRQSLLPYFKTVGLRGVEE